MRRRFMLPILTLLLLLIAYPLVLPGNAVVERISVRSNSCVTPEKMQAALDDSGWTLDDSKRYYLVSYATRTKSYLPFSVGQLYSEATNNSPAKVFGLEPLFEYILQPFGERVVYAEFLLELEEEQSVRQVALGVPFTIKSEGTLPVSIPASVSPDVQITIEEDPTPS